MAEDDPGVDRPESDEVAADEVGGGGLDDDLDVETLSPGARFAFDERPYAFEKSHVEAAVALLLEVAETGHHAGEAMRRVASTRGVAEEQAPLIRELWLALNYRLRLHLQGEDAGCDLVPATAVGDSSWPPQPHTVTSEVRELWREVAQDSTLPDPVRAHFNDLLVVAKDPSPHIHAETAAEAYLSVAAAMDATAFKATETLVRAWELSRRFKLVTVEARAVGQMLDFVSSGLDAGPGLPGVVLPALSTCCAALHPARSGAFDPAMPARVDQLLQRALRTYRRSDLTSEIARLIRQRSSGAEEIEATHRAEVQARLDEADRATSAAVRMHFLNAAAQLAGDLGLGDLRQHAIRELQRISPDDLGLQRIAVEGSLPRDVFEGYFDQFTQSPDRRDGLMAFLHSECPTGDVAQLRRTADDLARISVLRRLFPVVVLGPDGLPVVEASSEEDKDEHDIAGIAAQQAATYGRLLAEGLFRVRDRYGVPDRDELTLLIADGGRGDAVLSERLAVAMEMYWAEDFSSCVHVAAPLVEAAARSLLRFLDEAVYRTQKAQVRGGYVGLHSLIEALESLDLDPSWAYHLKWLLISPYGPNLRNSVAHGFGGGANPVHAALVLRSAALLVLLLPPADQIGSGGPSSEEYRAELRSLLPRPVSSPVPWPEPSIGSLVRNLIARIGRSLRAVLRR